MHHFSRAFKSLTIWAVLAATLAACGSPNQVNPPAGSTPAVNLPPPSPTLTARPFPAEKLLWNFVMAEGEQGTWCEAPTGAKGYAWARQLIIDTAQQYQLPDFNATGQYSVEYQVNGHAVGAPAGMDITFDNLNGNLCIHVNSEITPGEYPLEVFINVSVSTPLDFPPIQEDSRVLLVKVLPALDPSSSAGDILALHSEGIILFDPENLSMTRLLIGDYPMRPTWSSDGSRIIYFESQGGVYVFKLDGLENALVAEGGYDPDWSPDGRWITFYIFPNQILDASADGSGVTTLVEGIKPDWSPFANEIAYLQRNELWLLQAGGASSRKLAGDVSVAIRAPGQDADDEFAWSPDGLRIAYFTNPSPDQPAALAVVGRDGTPPVYLANVGQFLTSKNSPGTLTWSPDGQTIALECDGLCLAGMDGTLRKVTDLPGINSLAWSHDGTKIFFGLWNTGLSVYDLSTNRVTPLLVSDFRSFSDLALRPAP